MPEIKDGQYQAGIKILGSAIEALHQSQTGCRRKEDSSQLRRRIEEAEGIIKKVKRELRIG